MVLKQLHSPPEWTELPVWQPGREGFPEARAAYGHRHKTTRYPLAQANEALAYRRAGRFDGVAVLLP